MMGKDGTLVCPAFLDWTRRQRCKACLHYFGASRVLSRPTEAHHWPPKGMGGARHRDDRVIPLCCRHHQQAQSYCISREQQDQWVAETRSEFLETCTVAELHAYVFALEVWKDRPLACPF